jgi:tetratricopeptide (TPR) repeat protein/tRNA A-37 threonylcarbamoyl transferase component Bud32
MTEATRWHRLSEALDHLLERDPVERERELEAIARRDAGFAAELRELLQAARCEGVLELGMAQAAPELLAALAEGRVPHDEDPAGQRIGAWRVLRVLGRGGMGEVLLAERDGDGFVQQAALKRLKRGMDSEELLRRFAQERRILASLEHPLIARLLDGGVDDEGRPYFAMEYVDGAPITTHAAVQALGVRERVALMQRVCDAVAYAQTRLVVHRDLKPTNVMVDARGEPRLLDFGIAKLLFESEDAAATRTGQRVLSPAYAAPEQITGEAISTATDVYALGVLLFELLTGRSPHARREEGSDRLLASLTDEVPESPSRALRRAGREQAERAYGRRSGESERFARQIAGDLDRIVLMALRREPARRYASASALADDLRRFLEGRPIAARGDSAGYRVRKLIQRNKVGAIAAALALVALIGGLGMALWQAEIARRHAADAEASREQARAQAQRAEQVKDFVIALFRTGNPERTAGGAKMSAADLLREASARIDRELGDTPEAQAELRVAIGDALAALGEREEALKLVETSVAQLRGLSPRPDEALAEALQQLAIFDENRGRLDESRRAATEALALFEGLGAGFALRRIQVRTTLAKIAALGGDLATAESEYRAILDERRSVVGADDPRLAVDWNNLGAIALRRDRYAQAERAYAEASRLMALDPEAPESRQAWLRLGRGTALMGHGDFSAARQELAAAREVAERSLHANHPIVANIAINAAKLARYEGRHEAAVTDAGRAHAILAELAHPDAAPAALQLGLALMAARRHPEAQARLAESVQRYEAGANRSPDYHLAQAALGLLAVERGQSDGIDAVQAAVATLHSEGHERSNAYAEALGLRARAAESVGHTVDAEAWRRREIDALTALLGARHPRVRDAERRTSGP